MAKHVRPLEVSQHGHSSMTWGFSSSLGFGDPYALILFRYLQFLTVAHLNEQCLQLLAISGVGEGLPTLSLIFIPSVPGLSSLPFLSASNASFFSSPLPHVRKGLSIYSRAVDSHGRHLPPVRDAFNFLNIPRISAGQ